MLQIEGNFLQQIALIVEQEYIWLTLILTVAVATADYDLVAINLADCR